VTIRDEHPLEPAPTDAHTHLHTSTLTHPQTSHRLPALDTLRGLVMVLMALDHTRDFFSSARVNPLDLASTTPAYFLTRWVTHFCAPVFILLAGAGAFLYAARGRTPAQLARYLLVRGLWLVVLELTLVHFGWTFTFDHRFMLAQVIWAIGWSLVVLAALVALRLPVWAIAGLGVAMIAGHNLLGSVDRADLGALNPLWTVLHRPGAIAVGRERELYVLYPLVPWIGVMAAGYGLGPLLLRSTAQRRRWLLRLGAGLTLAFFVLRFANLYGDPHPWQPRADLLRSAFDFLNVEKYPPSLLYLLITLGPALLLLAWLDRFSLSPGLGARFLSTFAAADLSCPWSMRCGRLWWLCCGRSARCLGGLSSGGGSGG
jgi:uncharacterized membrane protein